MKEQIQELEQLKQWAANAAVELQKKTDVAIQRLEAERGQWQNTRTGLERNAVQAIHDAVRLQSGDIKRQTVEAFAGPLHDIQQAAGYVRQNIKDVKWLTFSLIFFVGLAIGLAIGYLPLRTDQNSMKEQVNRIEQGLTAQPQPVTDPTALDSINCLPKGSQSERRLLGLESRLWICALRAWNEQKSARPTNPQPRRLH